MGFWRADTLEKIPYIDATAIMIWHAYQLVLIPKE